MKKIIQLSYLVILVFTFEVAHAQQKEKQEEITIQSSVVDNQGNPVAGAKIHGNEGRVTAETDAEGQFTIAVRGSSGFLVEATGYESKVVGQDEVRSVIILQPASYLRGEKDRVMIAFGSVKRADLLGAVSVIEPDEFAGYDNTQNVPDAVFGRVPGLFGAPNVRGLGNAMVVLDGIPRYSRITDVDLNMEEVDQITVLKDAGAVALYGAQARNGVIIITTKRGKAGRREMNVLGQFGLAEPKAFPRYLGSADYMELYNEARQNDGLSELFDTETIENYRTGNPYRYPDVDYYSSAYLKSFRSTSKLLAEFSGGNDNASFYANLGWGRTGSLLNFGEGKNASSNRFNSRANVNFKITDFIKSNVDIAGIFDFSRAPRGNYWGDAAVLRPHLFTPLIPMNMLEKNDEAINAMVQARKNDVDGLYLLGGTQQNQTNPFADIYAGGYNQPARRTLQFNNGIDIDLGSVIQGLSLRTNVSFDFYNYYNQSIVNQYSIYEPFWFGDSIAGLTQYGTDSRPGTQNVNESDFLRRIGFFGQADYNRSFSDAHHLSATLLGFVNTVKLKGAVQPDKNLHAGLRLAYNFRHTYYVDFSSAYVHSVQLPDGSRGGFSPTVSLGWLLSGEKFMSGSKLVDFLKLKVSAGILNSDMSLAGFYYYDNIYGGSGRFYWSDGAWSNGGMTSRQGAAPALGYEKRKEVNLGLEGRFFDRSLGVDFNYFHTRIADQYVRPANLYPGYYSDFIPYDNYGENAYSGFELQLDFARRFGDFGFNLGASAMYWDSEVIQRDELFQEEYLYRRGKPVDAIFGLESEGFFQDNNETESHAFQSFGEVRAGDIKYKDQNNDGVIDDNDQVKIGRSMPPLTCGLSINLTYKNLSLFALGSGALGADSYLSGNYYWVDGDKKYSEVVMGRWTEATRTTATYPRLSSKTNSNNFRVSDFWLYENNYFDLSRVQLTYNMSDKLSEILGMKRLSIYLIGSNLLTISKHRDVRELNVGTEPQYRYYTMGLRCMF